MRGTGVVSGSDYELHGVEQATPTLWELRMRCAQCGLFPCLLPTDTACASVEEIVWDASREHTRRHLPS